MSDIEALYKRGEEAFQKRNYDYARDLFLNIINLDPDHEKAHKSLYATCLQKNKETGGSGKLTLMALQSKVQIELATAKSNPTKKVEILLRYLSNDPQNAKLRHTAAESLKALGKWGGCAAEAEIALAADPKNIPAAKVLVESLIHLGRVADAQKHLDKILVFIHDDRDLMKMQRDLAAKQAMQRANLENASTGKDGYRTSLKDASKASDLEKAQHLIVTEEDLARVVEQLKADLDSNPTDAKIPRRIADLYYEKKKDYGEAKSWYQKASQLAPQDTVLRDKVDDCSLKQMDEDIDRATKGGDPKVSELKRKRLEFLIQTFERRVADRPTDMALRFELGKAYWQVPAFTDKAIAEFQQSMKDPKKKRDSHIYLGMCFQRKKMFDMADTQYVKAEEEGGSVLTQAVQLQIWYNRAICYAEAGKHPDAISLGKKIMEQDISFRDISKRVDEWAGVGKS